MTSNPSVCHHGVTTLELSGSLPWLFLLSFLEVLSRTSSNTLSCDASRPTGIGVPVVSVSLGLRVINPQSLSHRIHSPSGTLNMVIIAASEARTLPYCTEEWYSTCGISPTASLVMHTQYIVIISATEARTLQARHRCWQDVGCDSLTQGIHAIPSAPSSPAVADMTMLHSEPGFCTGNWSTNFGISSNASLVSALFFCKSCHVLTCTHQGTLASLDGHQASRISVCVWNTQGRRFVEPRCGFPAQSWPHHLQIPEQTHNWDVGSEAIEDTPPLHQRTWRSFRPQPPASVPRTAARNANAISASRAQQTPVRENNKQNIQIWHLARTLPKSTRIYFHLPFSNLIINLENPRFGNVS